MDFRRYDIIGYNENTILQNPKMNRLLRRHQGIYIKKCAATMTAHTQLMNNEDKYNPLKEIIIFKAPCLLRGGTKPSIA